MSFYDLTKDERISMVALISDQLTIGFQHLETSQIVHYFSDSDTYIRKAAYLGTGRIYFSKPVLQQNILLVLTNLMQNETFYIRQTVVNAAGEIGKVDFEKVRIFFDQGLKDSHHSVRNAVIGSLKKMGEKNPLPVLEYSKLYLHHPDAEIRREICHGLELYGRTHPEAILPMLQELQFEKVKKVRNMVIHVIGQISYKKDCLPKVIAHLKTWENKEIVMASVEEIIEVHENYKNFSAVTQKEAITYIEKML